MGNPGTGGFQPDTGHRIPELQAVFRLVDGFWRCANQFDAVFLEHPVAVQVQCAVQCGLAAHGRQDGIGTFFLDDFFNNLPGDGLDVGHIRHVGVGHDGRRVAVDEDDPVPFLAQRLAGLGAGIVEFTCLADDDWTGSDDEDAFDVCSFWHFSARCSAA